MFKRLIRWLYGPSDKPSPPRVLFIGGPRDKVVTPWDEEWETLEIGYRKRITGEIDGVWHCYEMRQLWNGEPQVKMYYMGVREDFVPGDDGWRVDVDERKGGGACDGQGDAG